jgi:hypothetical protein
MARRPVVRFMILCEDVVADPGNPRRLSLIGLLNAIRSTGDQPYPLLYREICIYVQMTECAGLGEFRVQLYHADSGSLIFETNSYEREFGDDPLEVHGMFFRIKNCRFPGPGLYLFEFCYNGIVEERCFLVMR